jgi:TATA-box binding protein (TBP) (component of TFIID and TFIIIB)
MNCMEEIKEFSDHNEESELISEITSQKITLNHSSSKYMDNLVNFLDIENKPNDMIISTMTVTCALDTEYNLDNICKYIDLNHTSIISVRYGDPHDERTNRTLIPEKAYIIQRKKNKKSFYNQATFKIKTKKSKIINLKLFKNGSIQMTGIKNMEGSIEALTKLFDELKKIKYIIEIDKTGKRKLVKKDFATDVSEIDITKVQKYKIAMINSNYNIDFNIDREKLYHIMLEDNIECAYDPIIHASVNVKFNHPEKKISIFIFEKGSIIITGARTCMQIKMAYDFINKYLLTNYMKIIKNEGFSNSTIMKYLGD